MDPTTQGGRFAVEARHRRLRARSPRVPWPLLALLAGLLAFVLASCGSPRYEYVTNKRAGTFLKIPTGWKHREVPELPMVGIDARNISPEGAQAVLKRTWVVGIDAAPTFDADHLLVADAPSPKGFVEVRQLLPTEARSISTNSLRNLLVPVDASVAAQQEATRRNPGAEAQNLLTPGFLLLADQDVHQAGGVHGTHLVYQLRTDAGLVTVDQTSLLDRDQTVLYHLVIACSSLCYAENGAKISEVQKSFTIKPKV
jgi:hypothetical protein